MRFRLKHNLKRPRLSVYRSNRHIYAQIVDDNSGRTLVAASSLNLENQGQTKTQVAAKVGAILAEKALKLNISQVVFDRGRFKYHGRVKALAEAAKAKGLVF